MKTTLLILSVVLLAACDPYGAIPREPVPEPERKPGVTITGSARIGVVYGEAGRDTRP